MPALSTTQEDQILDYCSKNNGQPYTEIAEHFSRQFGFQVTQSQVHHLMIDHSIGIRDQIVNQAPEAGTQPSSST